mmetsp:Transcript_75036/g.160738  ORF Transcript_75036/g.160738 Transcript_75036/m.160738 type:complete len:269 (+) Transcript_75036:82-888(+)
MLHGRCFAELRKAPISSRGGRCCGLICRIVRPGLLCARMASHPPRSSLVRMEGDRPTVVAMRNAGDVELLVVRKSVVVLEQRRVCHVADAESVHACHHEKILPAVGAHRMHALIDVSAIDRERCLGDDLERAHHSELVVAILQVEAFIVAGRRFQGHDVLLEDVRKEDGIGVKLHQPVKAFVRLSLHDLLHYVGKDHHVRNRAPRGHLSLPPLENGAAIACEDAHAFYLEIVHESDLVRARGHDGDAVQRRAQKVRLSTRRKRSLIRH